MLVNLSLCLLVQASYTFDCHYSIFNLPIPSLKKKKKPPLPSHIFCLMYSHFSLNLELSFVTTTFSSDVLLGLGPPQVYSRDSVKNHLL